ncbi:MAG TPA: glycoside hydrolase family 3 C-terminal domain-containing protein [Verrucomicrobiae bacterium]|jgi:beta-glucosidase|nr:glycoside hydrolase family 3 C-terminal domain-containing protein [Verrucomicrobiae bacterium]
MNMRIVIPVLLLAFNTLIWVAPARADDETCASCDHLVQASGQFEHYKSADDMQIQGATPNEAAAFREEVNGDHFTITISRLPAGKLTVTIGEAETFFQHPGERVFDVTCDGTTLAKNFDIVAAAGSPNKVCTITAQVNHAPETNHGPLTLTFSAVKNRAKFNTLEIRDASGNSLVSMNAADLADPLTAAANKPPVVNSPAIWKNPSKPMDDRIHDLMSRMSLAEKVGQIRNTAPGIPRLGVPAYDYWSEALHGVGFAGVATVFPQAIGNAATWDTPLLKSVGDVISTEARAKFNDYANHHNGDSKRFYCLTFWSPNVNIFRDPRWGRGQETYGEDPFLTGSFAVAFIDGLQGNDPKYMKAMGCAKHYAVHSGPEPLRHEFNATPPERDIYETYLPQFEMAVRQGHVGGVMGAYSALDGVPCCANYFLLTDILRKQWGFDGYIVSDCDAVHDIFSGHHFADSLPAASSAAVKAGCDICCGGSYNSLLKAVQEKLITEPEVDGALYYALKTRFRLGLFDPPQDVPWSNVGIDQNDTPDHEALALKAAEESMVLLKNNGLLPLNRHRIKRIAVIGENADSVPVLVGNYNGTPARPVTILEGIKAVAGPDIRVTYSRGGPLALAKDNSNTPTPETTAQAVADAKAADVVIYVGGINAQLEGEESRKANAYIGFYGGDRTQIELPSVQVQLLRALHATGKPIVFVNCSGSAMAMPWEDRHLPAILQAWYPGEQGGRAVGEVLFGAVNPAGRLPVTFYRSTADLPDFEDYSMANRTYRYFKGNPLYAFGHGLSYTRFIYRNGALDQPRLTAGDTLKVSFDLRNSGARDGDEVAQVYFRHVKSAVPQPNMALCGFTRIHIAKGDTARITMDIPVERFRYWDTAAKQYVVEPGKYQLLIGGSSDKIRLRVPFEVAAAGAAKAVGQTHLASR